MPAERKRERHLVSGDELGRTHRLDVVSMRHRPYAVIAVEAAAVPSDVRGWCSQRLIVECAE